MQDILKRQKIPFSKECQEASVLKHTQFRTEQMSNWKDNSCYSMSNELVNEKERDFPGGSVVRTLCFHCTGHGFDPCLGN